MLDFGTFENFFFFFYHSEILDIVESFHCVQFQEKSISQMPKSGKKTRQFIQQNIQQSQYLNDYTFNKHVPIVSRKLSFIYGNALT